MFRSCEALVAFIASLKLYCWLAGKPTRHSTFTRKQLKSWINTRRGGILQQWVYRNCVISGTRLLLYKGQQPANLSLSLSLSLSVFHFPYGKSIMIEVHAIKFGMVKTHWYGYEFLGPKGQRSRSQGGEIECVCTCCRGTPNIIPHAH